MLSSFTTNSSGGLRAHREEVRKWAINASHIEWFEIEYPTLVRAPAAAISRLVEFLGPERVPNESAMTAVIDPGLYRRRT